MTHRTKFMDNLEIGVRVMFYIASELENISDIHDEKIKIISVDEWCNRGHGRFLRSAQPQSIDITSPRLFGPISRPIFCGRAMLPRKYVAEILNCQIIGGSRIVFVSPTIALHDELALSFADQYGKKLAHILKARRKRARRESKLNGVQPYRTLRRFSEAILISCDYEQNYFHWISECLPKLLMIDEYPELRTLPLVIVSGLHANLDRALDYLNQYHHPIVTLEKGEIASVERLILPSDISRLLDNYEFPTSYQRDCAFDVTAIRRVSDTLRSVVPDIGDTTCNRIYLSRETAKIRKPTNESTLIDIAIAEGFEILNVGEMSLEEQISRFRAAQIIAGPTGAAFTNIIFCNPYAKALIFSSNDPNSSFQIFHQIGKAVSCDVAYLVGQKEFSSDGPGVHENYFVQPGAFKSAIATLSNSFN